MTKTIRTITQLTMGHARLDFVDGTSQTLARGSHELLSLKSGDEYPPSAPQSGLTSSRVVAISPRKDGHHDVTLANGDIVIIERGASVTRVGEDHFYVKSEAQDAVDAQTSEAVAEQSESAQ